MWVNGQTVIVAILQHGLAPVELAVVMLDVVHVGREPLDPWPPVAGPPGFVGGPEVRRSTAAISSRSNAMLPLCPSPAGRRYPDALAQ